MSTLRPAIPPVLPLAATDALSSAAVSLHAPWALVRGGPVQRAANLMARGAPVLEASRIAARQGKGHVGEIQQSATYSARSGALGRPFHARPNPQANDPRVDVELRRGSRGRAAGAQVKVGSARYVLRAAQSGRYQMLVVNKEAREAIAEGHGWDLSDRLDFRGSEATTLSAAHCEETATESIVRVLRDEAPVGWFDTVVSCAQAGGRVALESFATGLLADVVHAAWSGVAMDLKAAVRAAASSAGRSAGRAAVQSYLLVQQFLSRARAQFSDRLLHRIASSTVTLGAVAEVIVETAINLVCVLRGEMSFEDLLRSFGVHVVTAAGGTAGLALAGLLTGGASWWVQGLAMLVGGALGAYGGRRVGIALFQSPTPPIASATATL